MTTDFFQRYPVDLYCSNTAKMHYVYLQKPNKPVECLYKLEDGTCSSRAFI